MSSMSATMSCMGARPLGLPLVIIRRCALQRQASRVRSTPSIAVTCAAMAGHCQPALYRNSIALIAAGLQAVYLVVMAIIPPPRQRRPGRCLSVSSGRHIRNSLRRSTPGLCRAPPSAPHTAPAPLRRGPYLVTCQCRASKPYASSSLALLGLAAEFGGLDLQYAVHAILRVLLVMAVSACNTLQRLGLPFGLEAGEGGGGRFVHSFQKLSYAGEGTHIVGCKHRSG